MTDKTGQELMAEKAEKYKSQFGDLPEHIAAASSFMMQNADVRRLTAACIRNRMCADGIAREGDSIYIRFVPEKFTIKHNGMSNDYPYTHPIFKEALLQLKESLCQTVDDINHQL